MYFRMFYFGLIDVKMNDWQSLTIKAENSNIKQVLQEKNRESGQMKAENARLLQSIADYKSKGDMAKETVQNLSSVIRDKGRKISKTYFLALKKRTKKFAWFCKDLKCVLKWRYFIKVHIFWEGHKIMRNLHLTFDWHYIGQK